MPAYEKEILRLQHQKARYELLRAEISAKKTEVENFINRVPKSDIRTILRLRYLDGKTWEQISRRFGNSHDWSKVKIHRFFKEKTCM